MQAYTGFADVYDIFMDNVPYEEWADYVAELLKEYGVATGLVLELGCGTGNITRRLASKGYDMIGIDNSEEMLEVAREKEYEGLGYEELEDDELEDEELSNKSPGILYLEQDMREFELFGTVAAVVSVCDSMNYITSEEDLKKVFQLVNNYLDPEGIFIFDLNTIHKYRDILGDTTIAENREDCSFIWENYYHEKEMMNQYDVTIYKEVQLEGILNQKGVSNQKGASNQKGTPKQTGALYERFEETHYQKGYELETIKRLLVEAGMDYIAAYEVGTKKAPDENTERMYIIARERQQKNKLYL